MTRAKAKKMNNNQKSSNRAFYDAQIDRFKERLKSAIGDESVRSFSKRCGISESVIRKYLNGSYPVLDKLPSLADAAGTTMEWLIGVDNENELNISDNASMLNIDNSKFALIPGYRIQVSAGNGAFNDDQVVPCRYLAFRRKWLSWRGFSEKDLVIVWAKGDSMEPTINNNDTLVVNMASTRPHDGNIYVFRNGDELFVKRYQTMMGAWRLISDNKIYPPLDIPKQEQYQFEVVGQVVHIAKDVGD